MRFVRYLTAAATALMSLMNLPFAVDDGGSGTPRPLAWLVSLAGVAGLVVVVAYLRRVPWAAWAVVAVGLLNLAGAVAALILDQPGAVIGLTLSLIITVLGLITARGTTQRPEAVLPSR